MPNNILRIIGYAVILILFVSLNDVYRKEGIFIEGWGVKIPFIIWSICLYLSLKKMQYPKDKIFLGTLYFLAIASYLFKFYLITLICTVGTSVWFNKSKKV